MSLKDAKPAESYEGLKTQFLAMKRLLLSMEQRLDFYYEQIERFDFPKIIKLEAELKSEREMNHILTEELEELILK
jgi:hypothetical protein